MIIRIKNTALIVNLENQPACDVRTNDGTLFIEFAANLAAPAANEENEARRARMKSLRDGLVPLAASTQRMFGHRHESITLTLQSNFEALSDIETIYTQKQDQELAYPIAKNASIATAIANKNTESDEDAVYRLVALSTAADRSGHSCVAFICDEDKNALALAYQLNKKYKQWTFYKVEIDNETDFLADLLTTHAEDFLNFYAADSTPLDIEFENDAKPAAGPK